MTLDDLLEEQTPQVRTEIEAIAAEAGTWEADWQVLLATGKRAAALSTVLGPLLKAGTQPKCHPEHWLCEVGDYVSDPDAFAPPTPPSEGAILEVLAFGPGINPKTGWTFRRLTPGAAWVRVS